MYVVCPILGLRIISFTTNYHLLLCKIYQTFFTLILQDLAWQSDTLRATAVATWFSHLANGTDRQTDGQHRGRYNDPTRHSAMR